MPRLRSDTRRRFVWRRDTSAPDPDAHGQVVTQHEDVDLWATYQELGGIERDIDGILSQPSTRIIVFTLTEHDRPGPNDLLRRFDQPDRWLAVLSVNEWAGGRGYRVELEEVLD